MAFPSNPTNGDIATVNDTDYIYDSSVRSWTRLPTANVTVGNLTVSGNTFTDKLYTTNGLYWSGNGEVIATGGGGGAAGFSQSTVTTLPTGDYGSGEESGIGTGSAATDAFEVPLGTLYDCMEPRGSLSTTDLNT